MTWKKQVIMAVTVVFLAAPLANADDYYDDFEDTHPLRIASYPVHAAGYVIEWLATRPLHALMSQPQLEPIFGHNKHAFDFDEQVVDMPTPTETVIAAETTASPADSDAVRRALEEAQAAVAEARAAAESARLAAEEAARSAEIADRVAEKQAQGFEESMKK